MIRSLALAASLTLAACQQQEAPPPSNEATVQPPAEKAEVPSLAGDWSVTKLDGKDVAGLGMSASFRSGQASLATGCIRRAWTYTQDRNIVSFTTNPGGSSNCGGSTPGADAETAYAALERANIAIFAREGKEASLSGTGGNLTLERR